MRYGYRRLTVLLKREGWEVNAKRIYRIYTEKGLIVRTRKRKERAQRQRVPLGHAARPNHKWSMDFVAPAAARRPLDPGADGRRPVHPRVPDPARRHRPERREGGRGVGQGVALRGTPESITVDNGTLWRTENIDLYQAQKMRRRKTARQTLQWNSLFATLNSVLSRHNPA